MSLRRERQNVSASSSEQSFHLSLCLCLHIINTKILFSPPFSRAFASTSLVCIASTSLLFRFIIIIISAKWFNVRCCCCCSFVRLLNADCHFVCRMVDFVCVPFLQSLLSFVRSSSIRPFSSFVRLTFLSLLSLSSSPSSSLSSQQTESDCN